MHLPVPFVHPNLPLLSSSTGTRNWVKSKLTLFCVASHVCVRRSERMNEAMKDAGQQTANCLLLLLSLLCRACVQCLCRYYHTFRYHKHSLQKVCAVTIGLCGILFGTFLYIWKNLGLSIPLPPLSNCLLLRCQIIIKWDLNSSRHWL
jgi:hypothetical protein